MANAQGKQLALLAIQGIWLGVAGCGGQPPPIATVEIPKDVPPQPEASAELPEAPSAAPEAPSAAPAAPSTLMTAPSARLKDPHAPPPGGLTVSNNAPVAPGGAPSVIPKLERLPPRPARPKSASRGGSSPADLNADKGVKGCCKGWNDCKGQGACKTDKHDCYGKNDCKGLGGCKPMVCPRP